MKRWLVLVLSLLLAGCAAEPTPTPGYDYSSEPLECYCAWDAKVVAWVDLNANGLRDPDEPPLPGVGVHVYGAGYGRQDINDGAPVTDSNGEAAASASMFPCKSDPISISVDAPEGYVLTVEQEQPQGLLNRTYAYGFVQEAGRPTVTPPALPPVCDFEVLDGVQVTDMALAPDGTLWVATAAQGALYRPAGSEEWQALTTADGLVDDRVNALTVLPDGAVWFATQGGAARLDEAGWTRLTAADGLPNDMVYKVVEMADGSAWLATGSGVAQLAPDGHTLTAINPGRDWACSGFFYAAAAPDNSLWSQSLDRLVHLDRPEESDSWFVYSADEAYEPDRLLPELVTVRRVAADSAGRLWFGGQGGLMRYDPAGDEWLFYNYESTDGALWDEVYGLALAPDDSLWVLASRYDETRLIHYSPAQELWQVYDRRHGVPKARPVALASAGEGMLWMAMETGVGRCYLRP